MFRDSKSTQKVFGTSSTLGPVLVIKLRRNGEVCEEEPEGSRTGVRVGSEGGGGER